MNLHYAKGEVEASRAAVARDTWAWGITDDWLQLMAEVERLRKQVRERACTCGRKGGHAWDCPANPNCEAAGKGVES